MAHVTVIDVAAGKAPPDMAVVIKVERISGIGTAGEIPVPPDATVLNAAGVRGG